MKAWVRLAVFDEGTEIVVPAGTIEKIGGTGELRLPLRIGAVRHDIPERRAGPPARRPDYMPAGGAASTCEVPGAVSVGLD